MVFQIDDQRRGLVKCFEISRLKNDIVHMSLSIGLKIRPVLSMLDFFKILLKAEEFRRVHNFSLQ